MKIFLFLSLIHICFKVTRQQNNCIWTSYSNTNSNGGILRNNVHSLDECKFFCIQLDNCVHGLDYNADQSQCWTSTSYATSVYPGITHYNYTCVGTNWSRSANTNSPGGNLQPTAQTLRDCKYLCIYTFACAFGLDWVWDAPMGQQCYLSNQNYTTPCNGVEHYTPTTGSGLPNNPLNDPNCTWTIYPDSNSPSGTPYTNTSLAQCQQKCKDIMCPGIDYDYQGIVPCYLSTNSIILIGSAEGVDHHSYTCPYLTSSPPAGMSTSMGNACDYVLYVNSGSTGGETTTYRTDADCRNQCSVRQNCKAYQWKHRSQQDNCIFYNTDSEPVNKGNQLGSSYYVFRKC